MIIFVTIITVAFFAHWTMDMQFKKQKLYAYSVSSLTVVGRPT